MTQIHTILIKDPPRIVVRETTKRAPPVFIHVRGLQGAKGEKGDIPEIASVSSEDINKLQW
jgi:hypothetical protein